MGCNKYEKTSEDAFVGGQIINPTSNNVVLLKENIPLDTIYLDQNNRFSYEIEDAAAGVYVLRHVPESQSFYLQPGDSILIRTNSLDFDESLHFSGEGSEKNNLLIETFLQTKRNTDLVLSYYKISPEEFERKTDSIQNHLLGLLKKANEKHEFSSEFVDFAEKSVNYDTYDLRERYTYMVNKYYKKFSHQFTNDFHAYRNRVNFNDTTLQTSPNYIRFIENYLINQSMAECAGANIDTNDCYDLYDHRNIKTRINLIDSLTDLPLVKNHFFSKFGALGIIMAKEREEIVSILELLKEKDYPEEKLQKLVQTGNVQLAYLPGMNVGNVALTDTSGNEKLFSEIVTGPTIIFLWSVYFPEKHIRSHKTIGNLRKKYPEITFLGVNLDNGERTKWLNTLNQYDYDKSNEFQLNYTIEKDIFENYLNKLLFIDGSGEVVIGDAYINSPDFESKILEFLNQ